VIRMENLQERIGYKFNDSELLKLALTHPSLAKKENNQRLEFLGDSVLGMVVARIIYDLFPSEQEGELARRQAALVRGETLAQAARDIGLGDVLKVATSEIQSGGRDNPSNLEDAFEALIGAMYLDGGIIAVERFVGPRWNKLARSIVSAPKDAKTALQEWAQGRGLPLPVYKLLETVGSAHAPVFTIEVLVMDNGTATAKAPSKRAAEQMAAAILLERFNNENI